MFNYQKFGSRENFANRSNKLDSCHSTIPVTNNFRFITYSTKYNRDVNSREDFEMKGVAMLVVSLRGVKSNRKHGLSYLIILKTDFWSQGTLRNGREEINFFFISFFQ